MVAAAISLVTLIVGLLIGRWWTRREVQQIRTLLRKTQLERDDMQRTHLGFVASIAAALDVRDLYTVGHSRRVSEYASQIAEEMGLPEEQIDEIRLGALLHDLGKIGIPDHLLLKPGRLTASEFAQLKEHPTIGRKILEGVEGMARYLPIIELHHENWDGSGYPHGNFQEETSLAARIVRVADAYDAMTSTRAYRPAHTHQYAVTELLKFAGTEFDPDVVRAFLDLSLAGKPYMPYLAQIHAA